jgi:hypothetical protein
MKSPGVLSVFLALAGTSLGAEQTYGSGYEPKPPVPFPAAFHDYQILPRSISPDQKYAFIYPKRSRLHEVPDIRLFLVTLRPFHIVSELPIQGRSLTANAHGYYTVNWAADTSASVFIVGAKWGPDQVWLTQLRDGNAAKLTDLTRVVRRQVLSNYKESRAPRYNDYYDFIFEGDDDWSVMDDGLTTLQRGWDLDSKGHVIVDTVCTTDPKELEPDRWAVRFKGTWDIASSQFIEKSITPLPKRLNQAMKRTADCVRSTFEMTFTF